MPNWLTIRGFAAETGYSEKAIRAKIEQGIWPMGPVWKYSVDNRIVVSQKGYDAWVEGAHGQGTRGPSNRRESAN